MNNIDLCPRNIKQNHHHNKNRISYFLPDNFMSTDLKLSETESAKRKPKREVKIYS